MDAADNSLMLAYTAGDRWHAGIGDPTPMGWVTVAAYFGTAVLCWIAAGRVGAGRQRGFWLLMGCGLALLGINKQLDLQTWLTLVAKQWALAGGWYRERRTLQAAFIATIALGGAAGLIGMRKLAGDATRPVVMALIGAVFLGCFVLIRASSFHHVDHAIGVNLGGLKVNWILELGSIACIGIAAICAWRRETTLIRPVGHSRPLDGRARG